MLDVTLTSQCSKVIEDANKANEIVGLQPARYLPCCQLRDQAESRGSRVFPSCRIGPQREDKVPFGGRSEESMSAS